MNETIGNRIAKFRKARGLTQEALAERMGVSSQAVSKWENDLSCPDISLLPKLCRVLGVTCDTLLTGSDNEVQLVPEQARKSMEELTLRVNILSSDGDKVRVNVPMTLVQVCMEVGMDTVPGITGNDAMKNVDLHRIWELVRQGAIGKLVEVETGDGDIIEVVVE